jgi:PAS domain S-box-containing protein
MSVSEPLIQASLLGDAVEHGPVAVFVADEERRYVAVNQAACALVGYTREELLALTISDLLASEDDSAWERMRDRGTISGVSRLRRKDGSTVDFRYVAGPTEVAGMPVYVSVGVAA